MAITVDIAFGMLEKRMKDINDLDVETRLQIATQLNQLLYEEQAKAASDRLLATATYSVSSSPDTHALPADYYDSQNYPCAFYLTDSEGNPTDNKLPITSYGARIRGYYFEGDNVIFTGFGTGSTSIIQKYVPEQEALTEIDDPFCVPDRYVELVLEGLVMMYYRYEEDPREFEADQRVARLIARFLSTIPRLPKVMIVRGGTAC